jgi:hypothetical protein
MPQGSRPDMIWQFFNRPMHDNFLTNGCVLATLQAKPLRDIPVFFKDVDYEIDRCGFTQQMVADKQSESARPDWMGGESNSYCLSRKTTFRKL